MDRHGQSILEYAVISACVVAALIAMHIYVKRGISGGLRNSADMIGSQYEPGVDDAILGSSAGFISSSITTTVRGDSFTRTLTTPYDSDGNGNKDSSVTETYIVTGPDEVSRWDSRFDDVIQNRSEDRGERKVIIPQDSSRRPEVTTIVGTETIYRE